MVLLPSSHLAVLSILYFVSADAFTVMVADATTTEATAPTTDALNSVQGPLNEVLGNVMLELTAFQYNMSEEMGKLHLSLDYLAHVQESIIEEVHKLKASQISMKEDLDNLKASSNTMKNAEIPSLEAPSAFYEKFSKFPSLTSSYKFHTEPLSWNAAYKTCAQESAHLVVVNSVDEASAVASLLTDEKYMHVGIMALYHSLDWITVTGQTLGSAGYEMWSDGEPNNMMNDESCGSITREATFNDVSCTRHTLTFVCEKETATIPSEISTADKMMDIGRNRLEGWSLGWSNERF